MKKLDIIDQILTVEYNYIKNMGWLKYKARQLMKLTKRALLRRLVFLKEIRKMG